MRGIRGEWVLYGAKQMRGGIDAAGVARDGRGVVMWYTGTGAVNGWRG